SHPNHEEAVVRRVSSQAPAGHGYEQHDGPGYEQPPRAVAHHHDAPYSPPSARQFSGGLSRADMSGPRAFVEYDLAAIEDWDRTDFYEAGFTDRHTTYAIVELTPAEERLANEHAIGDGKTQLMNAFTEMVKRSVYKIGGEHATYEMVEDWMKAIGAPGRKAVEQCFQRLNFLTEKQGEKVLATGKRGRG